MKQIVAITGANGFIGSHLVELLVKKNFYVKCIVRPSSNLKWIEDLPIEVIDCGLADVVKLEQAFKGAEYVFHLAGGVKAKNQQAYDFANVSLTKNVLEACKTSPTIKKIIVTSSLAAAGPAKLNEPISEKKVRQPLSKYGISKMRQEQLTEQYFDELPITIIRPPVVYGARDTEVFQFIELVNRGLMLKAGFNKKYISIIYVEDLVNGMLQAAFSEECVSETYFLSGDEIFNWDEMGQIVASILNKKPVKLMVPHIILGAIAAVAELGGVLTNSTPTLNFEKVKEMKQVAWTCYNEKAKKDFAFKPYFSLQQGMLKTINWYKQNNWI